MGGIHRINHPYGWFCDIVKNAHYSDVYSQDLQGFNMLYVINEPLDCIKNIHSYHVDNQKPSEKNADPEAQRNSIISSAIQVINGYFF